MAPTMALYHGTQPWFPTITMALQICQPSHGTSRHPTMAPYHVTQQWHCHGTLPCHPAMALPWHPAMAPGSGSPTQQWHPAMAHRTGIRQWRPTQQWHPAMAHGNGTRQWHLAMAPYDGTTSSPPSNGTLPCTSPWRPAMAPCVPRPICQSGSSPPLLLEVRTPIAKAIWGKIQLVSSQLLSVSYLPVQWVQSYHPSCLAFQNLDCNLILDARYLTTLKVLARMRQMNTKLDANGKNFAKPPFSALLNILAPCFLTQWCFMEISQIRITLGIASIFHRRVWAIDFTAPGENLPSGMNEMSWREYVHTGVWIELPKRLRCPTIFRVCKACLPLGCQRKTYEKLPVPNLRSWPALKAL